MEITVLMNDNKRDESNLISEHGLSFLIEIEGKYLIYDTGCSKNTYSNIKKLKLTETKVDYIILSHGHYDHVGGLSYIRKMLKEDGKIIVGEKFFENNKKYHLYNNNEKRFIGNTEKRDSQYLEVSSNCNFGDFEIINMEYEDTKKDIDCEGLLVEKDGKLVEDKFEEEIALIIKGERNVLITGCTHNDLFRLIDKIEYKIDFILGGLHYKDKKDKEIERFVEELLNKNIKNLYLMHCTGKYLINELKKKKLNVNELLVGDKVEI